MKVSLYKNIHHTTDGLVYDIDHILAEIRNGRWQDLFLKISIEQDKKVRQNLKKQVPYFTTSGTFQTRNNDGLIEHSGLIAIDFDELSDIDDTFRELSKDPYTFALFRSISAKGLCCIVKIDPSRHADAFEGLQDYYYHKLQLTIDPACKDVARPRYISYDPDLYHNSSSKAFKEYLSREVKKQTLEAQKVSFIHTTTKFERVLYSIDKDITGKYPQWIKLGFAIAQEYGTSGLAYFHHISKYSPSYDPAATERQYQYCLKYNNGQTSISTFYYYAKLHGYPVSSEREDYISKLAYFAKESGKPAEALASMVDDKLTADDNEVIHAVYASDKFKPGKDEKDKKLNIDDVELWLRTHYRIKKNIITRVYELDGRELESEDLNSIYIDGKKKFEKLTRELFDTILFSNQTPTYDPIREYFDSLAWDGYDRLTDLSDSITSDTGTPEWRRLMITKWLLGIVETIYTKEPNILCLVLAGAKNTGKTQFFKRLLPDPLKRFFANSQLDKQKDDEILMTQKLIIFDDEYSGKSKQDSKHMKKMLSADSFTLREPYGKKNVTLRRVASLCGTCNETELLNDATGNRRILVIEATGRFDYAAYNAIDKGQLFAQVKQMHLDGMESTLTAEEIDLLDEYTASRYAEVSIEAEMIHQYFEPSYVGSEYDFKTTSAIKDYIEGATKQKLSVKKLGMDLRRLGYQRIKKGGFYGYIIVQKVWMNTHKNVPDEVAPF